MSKNKLQKFAQLEDFANVVQRECQDNPFKLKSFLADDKPLIVELACGYGEYTLAMAKQTPDKKFIGIDIQGERIYQGAKQALEINLDNVLFLRIYIENLLDYLPEKSVGEIWLTFPDPYPKKRHVKRRLTGIHFLKLYQKVLKPGGILHLKTDDPTLFDFSLENLTEFGAEIDAKANIVSRDIYAENLAVPFLYEQTRFEKKHLAKGKKIHYLQVGF